MRSSYTHPVSYPRALAGAPQTGSENQPVSSIFAAEGGYQDFVLKGGEWTVLYLSAAAAIIALLVGVYLARSVMAEDAGTEKMQEIAKAIQVGASAYLQRQFKTIGIILVPLAAIVFLTSVAVVKPDGTEALSFAASGTARTIAFIFGCFMSGLTGFVGVTLATRGNVRTAAAAKTGSLPRPRPGWPSARRRRRHVHRRPRPARGDRHHHDLPEHELGDPRRVRIRWLAARAVPPGRRRHFHEAADVGADLVGKVEAGRGRPRNPGTIADSVEDNVGDCAGMASDLFEATRSRSSPRSSSVSPPSTPSAPTRRSDSSSRSPPGPSVSWRRSPACSR